MYLQNLLTLDYVQLSLQSSNYYHKKFLPAQILNANLISGEFEHTSKEAVADFKGKVPDLASNGVQDLFKFYTKHITA